MEINEFNRAVITQEITHDRAEHAALRIIAGAFNRTDKRPQFSNPVRPDDDDIVLMEYLRRQKSSWRDIESAPKDGTSIEVWDESSGAVNPAVVFWENDVWVYADNLLADAAPDGAIPSHWRPCSEPPR